MTTRFRVLLAGAAIAAIAAVPALAQAGTGTSDDDGADVPITGPALAAASAAALEHLGDGTVTETEIGDEESYYEIEVTLSDGRQVDVQLDRGFNVVGTEHDGVGSDD